MIQDAAVPTGFEPTPTTVERQGILYTAGSWTPDALVALARGLRTEGRRSLSAISDRDLIDAWSATVAVFRDRGSPERLALDPMLARLCQLSPAGLDSALDVVLGGVAREHAIEMLAAAHEQALPVEPEALVLVVLASNLPGLLVQTLLPALILRLPVLLKSPSSEPLFGPAFIRSLLERLPELERSVSAVCWQGGDRALEDPLLTETTRILAYGEEDALSDLRRRAPAGLFEYGPKTSLAIVTGSYDPHRLAAALASDIALFDQRGCLSVQAVFTTGEPRLLARALAEELARLFDIWPPGPIDPVVAAGVQQIRSEAAMRGLWVADLPLPVGTVVVEPQPRFAPTPGLRTVRVHSVDRPEAIPAILGEWTGSLQGLALEGEEAWQLRPALATLGVSRFTPPGQLQHADASWHNGGVHPLSVLSGRNAP